MFEEEFTPKKGTLSKSLIYLQQLGKIGAKKYRIVLPNSFEQLIEKANLCYQNEFIINSIYNESGNLITSIEDIYPGMLILVSSLLPEIKKLSPEKKKLKKFPHSTKKITPETFNNFFGTVSMKELNNKSFLILKNDMDFLAEIDEYSPNKIKNLEINNNLNEKNIKEKEEEQILIEKFKEILNFENNNNINLLLNNLNLEKKNYFLNLINLEFKQKDWWYNLIFKYILNKTINNLPEEIIGLKDIQFKIRKIINEHNFLNSSQLFKLGIIGPEHSGKNLLFILFIKNILLNLIINDKWKNTFIFFLNFNEFNNLINLNDFFLLYIKNLFNLIKIQKPNLINLIDIIEISFQQIFIYNTIPNLNLNFNNEININEIQNIINEISFNYLNTFNYEKLIEKIFLLPFEFLKIFKFNQIFILFNNIFNFQIKIFNQNFNSLKFINLILLKSNFLIKSINQKFLFKEFSFIDFFSTLNLINFKDDLILKIEFEDNIIIKIDSNNLNGISTLILIWNKIKFLLLNINNSNDILIKEEYNLLLIQFTEELLNKLFINNNLKIKLIQKC